MKILAKYFTILQEIQKKEIRERPQLMKMLYVYWLVESESARNQIIHKLIKENILVKLWSVYQVVEHTKYKKL